MHAENPAPDLPPYSLDVQGLDLGSATKAVGLELIETESREPLAGEYAARIWAALFPALAAKEHYAVDFFSHLDRVRDFCVAQHIAFREAAGRCLVISQPAVEVLEKLIARFESTKRPTRATPSAPSAKPPKAGLRSSARLSGRAKSSVVCVRSCSRSMSTSSGPSDLKTRLK